MRVLIASDGVAGLSSGATGDVVGGAFARQGAQVAVVPLAVGGAELAEALSRIAPGARLTQCRELAQVRAAVLEPVSDTHFLDLSDLAWPELAEVDGLLSASERGRVRAEHGHHLVAVVAHAEAELPLTGMPGSIADRGRRENEDLAETLRRNSAAERWLAELQVSDAPGCGARGGVGALVVALGGAVRSGIATCSGAALLERGIAQADLVVTGAQSLDFIDVGGPIVAHATRLAEAALVPVIAIVGRCFVSPRELRLSGIENAYALVEAAAPEDPSPEELERTSHRVAATWRW